VVALTVAIAFRRWSSEATCRYLRLGSSPVGTFLVAIAGLSRLGWPIQTWDGHSRAERLDNRVFWTVTLVGLGVLFISWILEMLTLDRD
jgi:hypothetical protein